MRLIAPIADRLLSAVVPRVTAGACCPPDTQQVACDGCGRTSQHLWMRAWKTCSYNCACKLMCGPCVNRSCPQP